MEILSSNADVLRAGQTGAQEEIGREKKATSHEGRVGRGEGGSREMGSGLGLSRGLERMEGSGFRVRESSYVASKGLLFIFSQKILL